MAGYALLCPGQGTQHPKMLDLALSCTEGRDALAAASDAVSIDIVARVQAGDDLFEAGFAQVAIVAASVATWQALAPHLPAPELIAGYSVGEVSAWSCAGSWDVGEVLRVVATRARFMKEASPAGASMMAVTSLHREALPAVLERHRLHVAIEVDHDHWVLAGLRSDLEAAALDLEAVGASPHPLAVNVPSHTPLLDAAAARLRSFLAEVAGRDPMAPVLRGIDGQALFSHGAAGDAIADAVARPIRWRACVEECVERGIGAALELPPGATLTRMLAARRIESRAVADFRSVEGVARWIERAS